MAKVLYLPILERLKNLQYFSKYFFLNKEIQLYLHPVRDNEILITNSGCTTLRRGKS